MYLVSFRASTGKNKKKYVKTQKYAQWRRRKGRFRQGRSVVAKGKVAARPGGLDTGIGSGKAGCFATKLLQAGSSCTRRGIGFRRAVLFLLQDRLLQGRPVLLRDRAPESEEIPPEPCPCATGRPQTADAVTALKRNSSGVLSLRHRTARHPFQTGLARIDRGG